MPRLRVAIVLCCYCLLTDQSNLVVNAKLFDLTASGLSVPPKGKAPLAFGRNTSGRRRGNNSNGSDFQQRYFTKIRGGSQRQENQTTSESNSNDKNSNEQPSARLFGTRPTKGIQQPMSLKKNVRKRLKDLTKYTKAALHDEDGAKKGKFLSALGPSLMAVWSNRGGSSEGRILSFGTVYALSLLGASVGFYSFLYFISVGYALGVIIPMVAALAVYQSQRRAANFAPMSWSTLLHSTLVILWGIRAFTFFLWREYFNWPALHEQIQQVNEKNAPAISVKLLIWVMYSFLYTAMLSPCWFRLQRSAVMTSTEYAARRFTPFRWLYTCLPILVQMTGLTLETVADYQKSTFKLDNRYEWCNVGLWSWSTHPNYLGEMLFWTGTYLGWILFDASSYAPISKFVSFRQFVFTTIGYVFITTVLRGSICSMSNQHWQKYGHLPEYAEFRQTHGLLGQKRRVIEKAIPEEEQMQSTSSEEQANKTTAAPASQ